MGLFSRSGTYDRRAHSVVSSRSATPIECVFLLDEPNNTFSVGSAASSQEEEPFESILQQSQVYNSLRCSTPTVATRWSNISIKSISSLALPIYANDIVNSHWYNFGSTQLETPQTSQEPFKPVGIGLPLTPPLTPLWFEKDGNGPTTPSNDSARENPTSDVEFPYQARILDTYTLYSPSEDLNRVPVEEGDLVALVPEPTGHWWKVKTQNHQTGYVFHESLLLLSGNGTNKIPYSYRAQAMYSYSAAQDDINQISFVKHEVLEIWDIEVPRPGKWWRARRENGETGIVPSNHLILLRTYYPRTDAKFPYLAKIVAKYSGLAQWVNSAEEAQGRDSHTTFFEGEVVALSKLAQGWRFVKNLDGEKAFIPPGFAELLQPS